MSFTLTAALDDKEGGEQEIGVFKKLLSGLTPCGRDSEMRLDMKY